MNPKNFKDILPFYRSFKQYCDKAALFDNENGFVEVAEYTNGELISKGDYRPGWLLDLVEVLEK